VRQVSVPDGALAAKPWTAGGFAELEAVDRVLDDPSFFEPFGAHFHAALGRPPLPIETYL
jgi:hypothetical protein